MSPNLFLVLNASGAVLRTFAGQYYVEIKATSDLHLHLHLQPTSMPSSIPPALSQGVFSASLCLVLVICPAVLLYHHLRPKGATLSQPRPSSQTLPTMSNITVSKILVHPLKAIEINLYDRLA